MKPRLERWKHLIAVAWPLIIANSFWNLQLTIDRIFLGMHLTEALGAAMAVMGVFWVPMALLQQTASYVTVFVAQHFGAGERDKIGAYVWASFYFSVVGGLIFLCFNFATPWFFNIVGHPAAIQAMEVEYFNALALSALPTALVAAISGFFIGLGKTKTVIGINFTGLILNAVLDYALIFGNWGAPAFGIAGAGYATGIATVGSVIYGLIILFQRRNRTEFSLMTQWRVRLSLLFQFLKFGIPSGMQWALEGLAFTVFLIVIGRSEYGESALASSSIAVTVMMLSVLPSMGVAQAVLTIVGQSLGEKNVEIAQTTVVDGIFVSMIYMGTVAISFLLFPQIYLSWFHNDSNQALWTQVTELTTILLRVIALFTIFDSVYLNISFALKGAGDTRFVSIVALLVPWPVMVLPAILLQQHSNAVVLSWLCAAAYVMVSTGILYIRFRQGKWRSMTVMET
jgi:MATE family multidrug resistance protein